MIVIDAENTWSMSVKQEVLNELAWSIVADIRRDYSAAEAARNPFLKSIHAQCIRDIDRLAVTSDPAGVPGASAAASAPSSSWTSPVRAAPSSRARWHA